MHPQLGLLTLHTREERRKALQVTVLAGQQVRGLRQQASNTPVMLLQPSNSEVMQRICLQVDLGLLQVLPAVDILILPAYIVVLRVCQHLKSCTGTTSPPKS